MKENKWLNITIDNFTIDDYLTVIEILSEDEYEQFDNLETGKKQDRREPKPKDERSVKFMNNLYKKVAKRICYDGTNPEILKYLKNEFIYKEIMKAIELIFEQIQVILDDIDDNMGMQDIEDYLIENKLLDYTFAGIKTWTFNKWVLFEYLISNGLTDTMNGNRFILPVLFNKSENMDDINLIIEKCQYINKGLNIKQTIKPYILSIKFVQMIRNTYRFIYNNGYSESTPSNQSNDNIKKHYKTFGWKETLRQLAEKGIFGTYNQCKEAKMLDVLEYLNISCSHDSAQSADIQNNNKK